MINQNQTKNVCFDEGPLGDSLHISLQAHETRKLIRHRNSFELRTADRNVVLVGSRSQTVWDAHRSEQMHSWVRGLTPAGTTNLQTPLKVFQSGVLMLPHVVQKDIRYRYFQQNSAPL